jgi:type IV pilus assembly protein PilW
MPRAVRGVTLIELMVGMVIALVATIVIFQVFAVSESYKRTTTGGSDALQSGGFGTYSLNRLIRGGGSGYATVPSVLGCPLSVYRGTTQLFGQSTAPYHVASPALPAPFATMLNFRLTLAPAIVSAGATDNDPDVIVVMAGHHSSIGRHTFVSSQGINTITLNDNSVFGINSTKDATATPQTQHDLLLAVDQDPGSARGAATTCDIAEAMDDPSVAAPYAIPNPIKLQPTSGVANFTGPDAFNNAGTPLHYSQSLAVANLGPVMGTSPPPGSGPQFLALGLGNDGQTDNALLALNLITGYNPAGSGSWVTHSLADNIISIKAIYGVSTQPLDANVSSWVAPTGPTWGASALSASVTDLSRLRAIRIAVIARNAQPEKRADDNLATTAHFSPASFTLFSDTAISKTVTNPDRRFRYKVFDITIPLRNMVLMTQNP